MMAKRRQVNKRRPRMRVPRLMALDTAAAAYARLLVDPCAATLTHPIYVGGDGGYLGRYEADFLTNNTGVGGFLFTPGGMGISADGTISTSGNNSMMQLINNGDLLQPATDSSACRWAVKGAAIEQPGYAALFPISAAVRPVAACLQVYYPGSELNRAGVISLARVNAGSILGDTGNGPTVAQYRAISNIVMRTPADHAEIKWQPSDGDMLYTDPTLITPPREMERKNALLLTYSGLPIVATGCIRIRLVVTYEWMPGAISGGILSNQSSRARSRNSLDEVLNYLDSLGEWWTTNGPRAAAGAAALFKAYQVFGGNPRQGRIEL